MTTRSAVVYRILDKQKGQQWTQMCTHSVPPYRPKPQTRVICEWISKIYLIVKSHSFFFFLPVKKAEVYNFADYMILISCDVVVIAESCGNISQFVHKWRKKWEGSCGACCVFVQFHIPFIQIFHGGTLKKKHWWPLWPQMSQELFFLSEQFVLTHIQIVN